MCQDPQCFPRRYFTLSIRGTALLVSHVHLHHKTFNVATQPNDIRNEPILCAHPSPFVMDSSRTLSSSKRSFECPQSTNPTSETGDKVQHHDPSITALRQQLDAFQQHITQLEVALNQVNESLASRTAHAAAITASHASTTRQLSQVALASTDQLVHLSRSFSQSTDHLRAQFRTIKSLADTTARVRAQLSHLEAQVARL